MRKAPFEEKLVVLDEKTTLEKQKLKAILDKLNPAGGYLDNGDGSGRHATKAKAKNKEKN
jgi:hypothetical protein